MKNKLMALMLGMAFAVVTMAPAFAQDPPKKEDAPKKDTKKKKGKKKDDMPKKDGGR